MELRYQEPLESSSIVAKQNKDRIEISRTIGIIIRPTQRPCDQQSHIGKVSQN